MKALFSLVPQNIGTQEKGETVRTCSSFIHAKENGRSYVTEYLRLDDGKADKYSSILVYRTAVPTLTVNLILRDGSDAAARL